MDSVLKWILFMCVCILNAYASTSFESFSIRAYETEQTKTVSTTIVNQNGKSADASCSFSYSTIDNNDKYEEDEEVMSKSNANKSLNDILNGLRGECITGKNPGDTYWDYQVCFGYDIQQKHSGESIVLGKFQANDKTHQLYGDGGKCVGIEGSPPRETNIEVRCSTSTATLLWAREEQMCKYSIVVAHPAACENDVFLVEDVNNNSKNNNQHLNLVRNAEDWNLEIYQDLNGKVVCRVMKVYDLTNKKSVNVEPVVRFTAFDISITEALTTTTSTSQRLRLGSYILREPGRKDITKERNYLYQAVSFPPSINKSNSEYSMSLEYLLISSQYDSMK